MRRLQVIFGNGTPTGKAVGASKTR